MKLIRTLSVLLLFAPPAWARTHETVQQSFSDFIKGELNGISLHSDGYLLAAPKLTPFAEIDAPILWAAELDSEGNLYVGTGNEGTIFKVDVEGTVTEVFKPNRLMSRAMAIDSRDQLYVAVSPEGGLYRISGNGTVEVYLSIPDAYVWDILIDEEDVLYLASGPHGVVYKVDTRGNEPEAKVFFDSEETHITAMDIDNEGNLLAGSATHGLLYRIDKEGGGKVIYATGDREIRRILGRPDGSIFFTSFNHPGRPVTKTQPSRESSASNASDKAGGSSNFAEDTPPKSSAASSRSIFSMTVTAKPDDGSSLYRMDAEGFVTRWWQYKDTSIYSVNEEEDGRIFLGTGSQGHLYTVAQPGDWTFLHDLESGGEITEIIKGPGDDTSYLICSNPGRILLLDNGQRNEGNFESEVVDFKQVSQFGSFQVFIEPNGKESVGVEVRAGNVEDPDRTWTDWTGLVGENLIFDNPLPPSRYLQYRLRFSGAEVAPVHQVRFFSRTQNLAPMVTSIKILDLGYEAKSITSTASAPNVDLARSINSGIEAEFEKLANKPRQVKVFEKPGSQTVVWRSVDGNDDDLIYKLQLARLGDGNWITLADHLEHTYHSFNTKGFSDGLYRLRVTASDEPSNPRIEAKSGEAVSNVFPIDNTPPVIVLEDFHRDGDTVTLKLTASDSTSLIRRANFRLNGNDMDSIHPDDGILDEKLESFTLELDVAEDSGQSLMVEIGDEVGNSTVLTRSLG